MEVCDTDTVGDASHVAAGSRGCRRSGRGRPAAHHRPRRARPTGSVSASRCSPAPPAKATTSRSSPWSSTTGCGPGARKRWSGRSREGGSRPNGWGSAGCCGGRGEERVVRRCQDGWGAIDPGANPGRPGSLEPGSSAGGRACAGLWRSVHHRQMPIRRVLEDPAIPRGETPTRHPRTGDQHPVRGIGRRPAGQPGAVDRDPGR
jgi:hypothetical protein